MNAVKKTLICLAVSAAALGGAAATAAPAFAGTNGRQIDVCVGKETANGIAWIVGKNQNGKESQSPNIALPRKRDCHLLKNWWWKGDVTIHSITGQAHRKKLNTHCDVPVKLAPDDNFVYCNLP
jgi:hypothetical protein